MRAAPAGPITPDPAEAEAHDGPNDPDSHASRERTAPDSVSSGPPGHVYVHSTHPCQGGQRERREPCPPRGRGRAQAARCRPHP
ncbi:DNA-3-methyladenine glycosylase [Streptomyces sp. NPDC101213]|uniref:DNA-3-methyladenine glycosylase n=1 Tax=Streptomyces sp. NPDC101213 TaxID=3366130 RepID=UPI0038170F3D